MIGLLRFLSGAVVLGLALYAIVTFGPAIEVAINPVLQNPQAVDVLTDTLNGQRRVSFQIAGYKARDCTLLNSGSEWQFDHQTQMAGFFDQSNTAIEMRSTRLPAATGFVSRRYWVPIPAAVGSYPDARLEIHWQYVCHAYYWLNQSLVVAIPSKE